jgi:hypothetical protein
MASSEVSDASFDVFPFEQLPEELQVLAGTERFYSSLHTVCQVLSP